MCKYEVCYSKRQSAPPLLAACERMKMKLTHMSAFAELLVGAVMGNWRSDDSRRPDVETKGEAAGSLGTAVSMKPHSRK